MSLSNFIKTILNIQDNNISFPEEDYCQIIQKDNLLIKVFKWFLKSNYCACPHCNSKNIVKNGSRNRKIKYIPIQNYNVELELNIQRYICKDMYTPYISLVKSIFPSAKIVIDKFHIVNLVNRAFNQTRISIMNSIQDKSLKRKLKLFWKLLLKYYPDLCRLNYYCQSFKCKLSSKDKVDYLLEKCPELEINFNIYQDIIQAIRLNNFKRLEDIVKKYLSSKEKREFLSF